MNTKIVFLIVMVFFNTLVFGQAAQEPAPHPESKTRSTTSTSQIVDLPILKRSFRPKITLQEALKIAEGYVKKNRIDVSSYYLLEARMIQYGGAQDVKEARWFFVWLHEDGAAGNAIQVSVSMSGKVAIHPSM